MASALSQQICCPVCLSDLREPVSIPCEHFYCRECIIHHLAATGNESTCPVCRCPFTRDEIRDSRLLRNIVDAARAHLEEFETLRARVRTRVRVRAQAVYATAVDETHNCDPNQHCCLIHNKPFKFFCETENQLMCVICREGGTHQRHHCKSLKDAFQDKKEKMSESLAVLLNEDETLVDLIEKQSTEVKKTKDKSKLLSDQISAQFKMMHQFLQQKEDEVKKLLDEKQNQILDMMGDNLLIMEEILSDARVKQGVLMSASDNNQPCQYLQWWKEYGQSLTDKPLSTLSNSMELSAQNFGVIPESLFLGPYETHLQFFTWKELLRSIQPVPHRHTVEDEGDQSIKISSSGLSIQPRKKSLKRNKDSSPWLRADSAFGTGQQYWEVEVGQKVDWGVGVCSCTSGKVDKDTTLCLSSDSGYYIHRANNMDRKHVVIEPLPRKIGVYLDCVRRQVSFYNADSMIHIDTIGLSKTLPFSLCVSPGLYLNGKNNDPLTVCWY